MCIYSTKTVNMKNPAQALKNHEYTLQHLSDGDRKPAGC